ncbi:MAG: LapA family protein [Alphaproteobacteria bacterium]
MRRLFFWIIGVPAAILIILLSIANRRPVTFSFDPVSTTDPAVSLEIPLFLLLFGAGFCGLLVGWLVGWSGQRRWRREARKQTREVSRLRSQEAQVQPEKPSETGTELVPQPGVSIESKLAS